MILRLFTARNNRRIAWTLLTVMSITGLRPEKAHALTSGPVQPEAQGFEPVGTTDMVDPFTGDFVYNIPLMDVEGYPINISYHGGVGMEQEASWVGTGWNITPGAVNRAVRGLPDEFNGDVVEKEFYVKPDTTIKVGLAAGVEAFGAGDPYVKIGGDLGGYLTLSNYKGVSVDFTTSAGINLGYGPLSAGANVGASVGSQTGGSINYGASVGLGVSRRVGDDLSAGGSFNLNVGGNYNPRIGVKNSAGFNASVKMSENTTRTSGSFSTGTSIPIGMQNYTAAITNPSYMNSYSGQIKLGGAIWGIYLDGKITGSMSTTRFEANGSRRGYGYLNLPNADDSSLVDFSREKDGNFNPTMSLLPQTHMTYDVYSVSGQGTGGSFRPVRNDFGSAYDPRMGSEGSGDDGNLEFGLGNLFSLGGDFKKTNSTTTSGPWDKYYHKYPMKPAGPGNVTSAEDVYYKEAGELTENNAPYLASDMGTTKAIMPDQFNTYVNNNGLQKPNASARIIRANHIYTLNGATLDTSAILDSKQIVSYDDTTGFRTYPTVHKTAYPRVQSAGRLKRNVQQNTEIIQTQKDGRRYIYGLPVLNHVQREATFAINHVTDTAQLARYLVNYTPGVDDKRENGNGLDNFYSSTVTPTYVSAHLLTGVLSNDYIDVTGDGITDDDLGTYTKFNYSLKSNDYRWRSPAQSGKAQYIPGYTTDHYDDKAAYVAGSRQNWMWHSVETKNYVAEFYVSKRLDAKGVPEALLSAASPYYHEKPYDTTGAVADNYSYKLDSIVLYNKHDRFMHGAAATPVKTVMFSYDYSLCKGIPNTFAASSDTVNNGKLTLRKIQIRYGNSNLNMSAAYTFDYTNNYPYNAANKDRWGSYKEPDGLMNNYEFPFTRQSPATDEYAKAWSLSAIGLPSGGVINVNYESDDYAYVQDLPAMEMFKVAGVGSSPTFTPGNMLYFSSKSPNLYYYFTRRKDAENKKLSFRENYLKDCNLLYFNIPVELASGQFEPIKGYAEVDAVDSCTDTTYGYIRMKVQDLTGTDAKSSPVVYTALNVGRYNLPKIMFPGSDPQASSMDNIVAGLKSGIRELFAVGKNPLQYYMDNNMAKSCDLKKAFVRLTSPGLMKKGGGQRVKSIKFYDNWAAMTGGLNATYGKEYNYTMQREDNKGVISSGVASWEPSSGGDEIPQRLPVKYAAVGGSKFPPNDAIDLYQEKPVCESFYSSPTVGYRKVTSRSINADKGRSSQSEDINYFYTAKDFPIRAEALTLYKEDPYLQFSLTDIKVSMQAQQGFGLVLNDMHGKPMNTEHWILKTDTTTKARELVSYQRNEYMTSSGQLYNMVPTFRYNAGSGVMDTVKKLMGVETDVTTDSRIMREESRTWDFSANLNGFYVPPVEFLAFPLGYGFPFGNINEFKEATTTKVTQQYGILSDVVSYNQGATTRLHNEVFDAQTGNALITSVNNEFGDRQYNVSYPAYWAYKEMGPVYDRQNAWDRIANPLIIDSFGAYSKRFVNYNPGYSAHYDLPSNMPVGRTIVDEQMPKYRLGDELLIYLSGANQSPVRTWVMGYTSDTDHCYAVLATREPYKPEGAWAMGTTLTGPVLYRVAQSGYKNRLGETIQSFTTTTPSNIFPHLQNNLTGLINLKATRFNHVLNQVFAANVVSDSLNPFVTGKVGAYRPQMEVVNLKKRDYTGGTTRMAGTFSSNAYWKVEKDNYPAYCPDSTIREGGTQFWQDSVYVPPHPIDTYNDLLDSMRISYLGGDAFQISYYKNAGFNSGNRQIILPGFGLSNAGQASLGNLNTGIATWTGFNMQTIGSTTNSFVVHDQILVSLMASYQTQVGTSQSSLSWNMTNHPGEEMLYTDGAKSALFYITCMGGGNFKIVKPTCVNTNSYIYPQFTNLYLFNPATMAYAGPAMTQGYWNYNVYTGPLFKNPFRVRNKILLGKVGHYDGTDNENWTKTSEVSKYNWYGAEIENKEEGLGYNSAVYGYNQQLPVCVAKNAKHGEVLFEGFEDYALLRNVPSMRAEYMKLFYSPVAPYLLSANALGGSYRTSTLQSSGQPFIVTAEDAHTGTYCMKTTGNVSIPLNSVAAGMTDGYSFRMKDSCKYVASIWLKPTSRPGTFSAQGYGAAPAITLDTTTNGATSPQLITATLLPKSNIIDDWQQYEVTFTAPPGYKNFRLNLGTGYFYDDVRIFPFVSNSKGFVYHPVTRKLVATLDENNYATFYEYDAEGNLVRTKKETAAGILTISETRSTHRKTN